MFTKSHFWIALVLMGICTSCSPETPSTPEVVQSTFKAQFTSDEERSIKNNKQTETDFADGIHSATINYTNHKTGYSNTYTLEVEVINGMVTQINFPKGGWLDSDHITPSELDEDGRATIQGEGGKTYDVQIRN